MGIPNFLLSLTQKIGNSHFLKQFLEFQFFKVKIWAWEFPNF